MGGLREGKERREGSAGEKSERERDKTEPVLSIHRQCSHLR